MYFAPPRLGSPGAGGGAGNRGATLDFDFVYRGAVLDADALTGGVQTWTDDPASVDNIGRWRAGSARRRATEVAFASIATFTRASTATGQAFGQITEVASGAIRAGTDLTTLAPMGALIESAATNGLRNPRGEGSAATTAAPASTVGLTLPTNWNAINRLSGLSLDVAPVTYAGITGLRVRYYGTSSGAPGAETIEFDARGAVAATAGLSYTGSFYYRLVAGTATAPVPRFISRNNVAGVVDNIAGSMTAPDATLRRATQILVAGVGAVDIAFGFHLPTFAASTAYDFSIDLFYPQLEANYFASSIALPPVGVPAAFTRAADNLSITGTAFSQVFGSGKGVTNLALQSQTLNTATWTTPSANTTFTADAVVAPDGTTTADLAIEGVSTGGASVRQIFTYTAGLTYTLSCYVKAATGTRYLGLLFSESTPQFGGLTGAIFDTTTGAVTLVINSATANAQSVGSGWYRCSITAPCQVTTLTNVNLKSLPGGTNMFPGSAGDGVSSLALWGAQIEVTPATLAPNLLTNPEAFDNATWTKTGATITANVASPVAPDGTTTAEKLATDGAATPHYAMSNIITPTAGAPYVFSVYARAAELSSAVVYFTGGGLADSGIAFDLSTGATSGAFGTAVVTTATSVGNSWWRLSVALSPSTAGGFAGRVAVASGAGVAGNGIHVWGANLVQSASAPDYVPLSRLTSPYISTTTVAVTKTGIDSGWAIFDVMMPQIAGATSQHVATVTDGTNGNRISVYNPAGGTELRVFMFVSGVSSVLSGSVGPIVAGTAFRVGMRWTSAGGVALCKDGGAINTGVLPTMPAGMDRLIFGGPSAGTTLNGRLRAVYAGPNGLITDANFIAACTAGADVRAILG